MTLIDAKIKQDYVIDSIKYDIHEDFAIRLNHLGFLEGEVIRVHRKTPITSSSLVVEIKGGMIALTKSEASFIKLKSN